MAGMSNFMFQMGQFSKFLVTTIIQKTPVYKENNRGIRSVLQVEVYESIKNGDKSLLVFKKCKL